MSFSSHLRVLITFVLIHLLDSVGHDTLACDHPETVNTHTHTRDYVQWCPDRRDKWCPDRRDKWCPEWGNKLTSETLNLLLSLKSAVREERL